MGTNTNNYYDEAAEAARRAAEIAALRRRMAELEALRNQYYQARNNVVDAIEECDKQSQALIDAQVALLNSYTISGKSADDGQLKSQYNSNNDLRNSLYNNTLVPMDAVISSLDTEINKCISNLQGYGVYATDSYKQSNLSNINPTYDEEFPTKANSSAIVFDSNRYKTDFLTAMDNVVSSGNKISEYISEAKRYCPNGFPGYNGFDYSEINSNGIINDAKNTVDYINSKIQIMYKIEECAKDKVLSLEALGVDTSKMSTADINTLNSCMANWDDSVNIGSIAIILNSLGLLGSKSTNSGGAITLSSDECSLKFINDTIGFKVNDKIFNGLEEGNTGSTTFLDKTSLDSLSIGDTVISNSVNGSSGQNYAGIYIGKDSYGIDRYIVNGNSSYTSSSYASIMSQENFVSSGDILKLNTNKVDTYNTLSDKYGEENISIGSYEGFRDCPDKFVVKIIKETGNKYNTFYEFGQNPEKDKRTTIQYMFVPTDATKVTSVIGYVPGSEGIADDIPNYIDVINNSHNSILTVSERSSDAGHAIMEAGELITSMGNKVEHLTSAGYSAGGAVAFNRTADFIEKFGTESVDIILEDGTCNFLNWQHHFDRAVEEETYLSKFSNSNVNVIFVSNNRTDNVVAQRIYEKMGLNTYIVTTKIENHGLVNDTVDASGLANFISGENVDSSILDGRSDWKIYQYGPKSSTYTGDSTQIANNISNIDSTVSQNTENVEYDFIQTSFADLLKKSRNSINSSNNNDTIKANNLTKSESIISKNDNSNESIISQDINSESFSTPLEFNPNTDLDEINKKKKQSHL